MATETTERGDGDEQRDDEAVAEAEHAVGEGDGHRVGGDHGDGIEHREVGDIGQDVEDGDERERYVDGPREVLVGVAKLLRHEVEVIPSGVGVDARIEAYGDLSRIRGAAREQCGRVEIVVSA